MLEQHKVIRWEAPPEAKGGPQVGLGRRGRSPWEAVADELRTHRGEWALIWERKAHRDSRSGGELANRINLARSECFAPLGDFEAVSRRHDGVVRTYARYLGDGELGS